jgi:hypothetical protein
MAKNKKTTPKRPDGISITVEARSPEQLDALFPYVLKMLTDFDQHQKELDGSQPFEL